MPRKWLSIRQADLDRQLDYAIDPTRAVDVRRRAMMLDYERHQKRNTNGAVLDRLKSAFITRYHQTRRARAKDEHDRPGAEHPTRRQWRHLVASTDFVAFVLASLRIEISDESPSLEIARWCLKLHQKQNASRINLSVLFKAAIAAAVDDWQQEHRGIRQNGGKVDPDECHFVAELAKLSEMIRDEKP